jgi:hypothetical protein
MKNTGTHRGLQSLSTRVGERIALLASKPKEEKDLAEMPKKPDSYLPSQSPLKEKVNSDKGKESAPQSGIRKQLASLINRLKTLWNRG